MENLLREYMERAFSDQGTGLSHDPGPVVTISREYGCPSKQIAQHLTQELNKLPEAGKPARWRFINKEIVEDAARHLELKPTEVNFMLNATGKGLMEDVLASFSPVYVSNHRMRKTLTAVVQSFAVQGHVVLVGRGGVGILQHAPATLHVRLIAPRDWRIEAVGREKGVSLSEAARLVDDMDRKRTALIEFLLGGKFHPSLFDLTLNCQRLSHDDIVLAILVLMKSKKLAG